jgi:hypothetical protein
LEDGDSDTADEVPLAGGVQLLPCTAELANIAAALVLRDGAEQRLAYLALYDQDYDWILIDTPPGHVARVGLRARGPGDRRCALSRRDVIRSRAAAPTLSSSGPG